MIVIFKTLIKEFLTKFIDYRLKRINKRNRNKLINKNLSIIASNCTGGFMYHWLGLEFRSPFINLFMENDDFITAMENFDEFIESPIIELKDNPHSYPVGIGVHGEKIHFMHYHNFREAIEFWEKRKLRINRDNMTVMLSNLGCGIESLEKTEKEIFDEELKILRRFNLLPFKNKIAFSGFNFKLTNVVYIKGYRDLPGHNLFDINKKSFYKRYLDQFDYVSYFNNMIN